MLGAALFLFLGGRFYAPLIGKVLGEREDRVTPAVTIDDGRDYVPTRTPVVFAHHYASIAGAGPIIGPVLAILYGWGPALLWILLGGVFLGAVHDYAVTHVAVREGGKNITVIARRYIGQGAFVMLLILLIALLALVCAAFLDLSASALISNVPASTLQLSEDQTVIQVENGQAAIGGIAYTSVIVITLCAPLVGVMYLKRKWPVWVCSLLAVGICALSILLGLMFPLSVSPVTWKLIISVYVLVSAGVPVWLFLQSRDFINVHILYLGIAFLFVALIAAAFRGGGQIADANAIPINNWTYASNHPELGPGWPTMFVVIACGAVSGFHSLCAGGTTCKQLGNEPAARKVGYYGMLLESFLAVCVVCCLVVGLSLTDYEAYCYPNRIKGNAILTFAMAVGRTANVGLGLPVAAGAVWAMLMLQGFLVTTLDTAIRLTRYMIEEGWATFFSRYDIFATTSASEGAQETFTPIELAGTGGLSTEEFDAHDQAEPLLISIPTQGPLRWLLKTLKYYWVNSGLAVLFMLLLGWGSGYKVLWHIFGSANQLLATLALLVVTCWLISRRRPVWYTLLPMLFMIVTSITRLIQLLVGTYLPAWPDKIPLTVTTILILGMTAGIIIMALRRWLAGDMKTKVVG
jgi:carbon starvation protein